MELKTRNFGIINYQENDVINFASGLVGMETYQNFIILAYENYQPLKFLQSLDNPEISFILVNPYLIDPTYKINTTFVDREEVKLEENGGVLVYIIMTLPGDPLKISVNFLAPIIINASNMKAKQLVMTESGYSVAQPIVLDTHFLSKEK